MKAVLVALLLAALSVGGFAQGSGDGSYKLQPEDILQILVYNENQVNAQVPVGKDGTISAPFVGIVSVAGKTTNDVEKELAKLYVQVLRIRDPRVSVTIIKYRQMRATVGGFVNRPAQYDIRQGDTVLTLLNEGGGPVPDRADLRRATLRRADSKELIPIDLYAMLTYGDTSQNYELQDGDELTVPEETLDRILVQGAVLQPGVYPYKEPMTVADAILQAHGEIRQRSMLSKVLVIRQIKGQPGQYLRIQCDFVRFIRKGDATQNVTLLPGDLVFVPEQNSPDLSTLSNALQSVFFLNNFFNQGIFGLHVFH